MLSHRLRRIRNEHFECSIGNCFHDGECNQVALGPDLYVLCISYYAWEGVAGKMMAVFTGRNYCVNAG